MRCGSGSEVRECMWPIDTLAPPRKAGARSASLCTLRLVPSERRYGPRWDARSARNALARAE
jgi:hypothetical protein